MDDYAEEFLSGEEGAAKAAVKRLTSRIADEMFKLTINAEDWDTLNAAQMARELLWEDEQDLRMEDFVEVSQTSVHSVSAFPSSSISDHRSDTHRSSLADMFADPQPSPALSALKTSLMTYYSYLVEARITNSSLNHIPLPSDLDPTLPVPLPTRFSTLWTLIRDILSSLVRLPFFALPFLVNIPIYLFGKFGVQLALDEVETQAQMKLALGVISSLLLYPVIAFGLFLGVFRTGGVVGTIVGLCTAGLCVWGLVMYHLSLIDDNYRQ
jgi:glycerol-3-phosphate O-acyltransferase/dihydroxyacetone phosphate acyltransferase